MERHYTYTLGLFQGELGAEFEKFTFAAVLALALLFFGSLAAKKIKGSGNLRSALIPSKKFRLFDFYDVFCEGFINFHDSILGKINRRYFPLSATLFLFVFSANMIGLIPGMPAITTTVWINVAMAMVVFIAFNYYGIKENGILGYLKHFAGGSPILSSLVLALLVAPFLFALEILSTVLRVLTLNLRLFWNISADHMILSIFNDMLGIKGGFVFYVLGTFVSFMQAFVFTILTMVYILLATAHEEESH